MLKVESAQAMECGSYTVPTPYHSFIDCFSKRRNERLIAQTECVSPRSAEKLVSRCYVSYLRWSRHLSALASTAA
jgi:hypothetical protein